MHLWFSARAAYVSIVRNKAASAVAIATMAFMLTALSMFILLAQGLDGAAAQLESKANLVADLSSTASQADATALSREIETRWPGTQVTYFSKEQAAAQFRKTFAHETDMLAALQGNPLPASLEVRVRNARLLRAIDGLLARDPRVSRIIFNPNLTKKLLEITTFVRIIGISLVVGLAFLALVIVINTIHLAVQSRLEEIEVMRLMGASPAFVRDPFIAEGAGFGLAGATLAAVTGAAFYLPIMRHLLAGSGTGSAGLIPIDTQPAFMWQVSGLVLLVGVGLGVVGSYISVRKAVRA